MEQQLIETIPIPLRNRKERRRIGSIIKHKIEGQNIPFTLSPVEAMDKIMRSSKRMKKHGIRPTENCVEPA